MPTIRILALIEAANVTGPARNLLSFARAARASGVEVSVAAFRRGRTEDNDPFAAAVAAAGLTFDFIPERGPLDRGHCPAIRALAALRRPDIIQTHGIKSHFLVRVSGIWRDAPWIAFHHGYTTTDLKMRLYNCLDRWSLRKPARVVTVSRAFGRELCGLGAPESRISIVHNAVDPAWAAAVRQIDPGPVRDRLGLAYGEPVVLAVGRLSREKAIPDLVRALALMAPPRPRVVVLGDGPQRARIERTAASLGVFDRLLLLGHASEVAPYYAIADAFVLPSHSEGSPNALLDAMAAGVPAVASAVGGVPEIAADGETALLVPPASPGALAAALSRMLGDPDLRARLVCAARARVLTEFPPERRTTALLRVYCDALTAAPRTEAG